MAAFICNFIKRGDLRPCEVLVPPLGVGGIRPCCGIHAPIKARLPPLPAGCCEHIIAGPPEHWCPRLVVPGDRLCPTHVARRDREDRLRVARNAAEAEAHRAHIALDVEMAGLRIPPVHMPRAGLDAALRGPAPAAPNPAVPARLDGAEIYRLANDRQNVHTGHVVKQTNAGEEKLLAVRTDGKPVGLRILRNFVNRGGSMQGFLRVANDVEHWYSTETCRRMGDRLYGRLLEGLWTLIEQQPEAQRAELKTRLWQEATESVGMCCEGHIARLVNVMSGFDEAFRPRVSLGEAIQAKMAEIAGKADLSAGQKVDVARVFLTALAISAEEQAPWLEALE
jgi:hypothetical protein